MTAVADETIAALARQHGWDERTDGAIEAASLSALAVGVATNGRLAWMRSGVAPGLDLPPISPDTVFRVASVTKWFTALAVMRLVERGLCDLDERLTHYLPELAVRPTVRQLLCHGSGLQREAPGERGWHGEGFMEGDALLDAAREAHNVLPPMRQWKYSNLGFQLLGLLVERISERPYEQFVEEELLRPAGMSATTFGGSPQALEQVLPGYERAPRNQGFAAADDRAVKLGRASGNLCSSVADLARFTGRVALGAREPLVSEDNLRAMYAPQIMLDDDWTVAWGLGVELSRQTGVLVAGHGGSVSTVSAIVLVAPEHDVGVIALTNVGASQMPVEALAQELLLDVTGTTGAAAAPESLPHDAAPINARALGTYYGSGMTLSIAEQDGMYAARWHHGAGGIVDHLAPIDDTSWRALSGDWLGEVGHFVENGAGELVGFEVAECPFGRIDD
jgi:CubicO group peptidase (beta-lactamase class C family)